MEVMPDMGKMGYDRAIVTFSPDGRLFQVEYAREAVKRGSTSVAVTFKDGIVVMAARPVDKLSVRNFQNEKIQQVDDHIGIVSSGLLGDARVLIDKARVKAQIHRITYEEPIDTLSLTKYISDLKQLHTQYAGLRPMGVSFLIAGMDERPFLFETDPGGSMFEWKAQAIGRGLETARKILETGWKENMDMKKAIALALKALKKSEKGITTENIEVAVINKNGFKRYEGKEKLNLLKKS
ncbi:MAG: archaeal proteasome endopeptidase complex subunit alpha [Candidatus Aenigmarchaeota archaeon]|nr:archaeal proteasome endopeptidase complex subunit alpha [Candidatus Aenigmarchaeota archaeon]